VFLDNNFAPRFHHQFLMRLLNGEKAQEVPKIVHALRARCRVGLNLQLAVREQVVGKRSRPQARHMVADRYRMLVPVGSSVNDSIDHWPIVTGKVRAWLKYRLDKPLDHEGSKRSRFLRKSSSRASPSEAFAAVVAPGNGYCNLRRSKLRKDASELSIAFN
jgi:hypothetical protein